MAQALVDGAEDAWAYATRAAAAAVQAGGPEGAYAAEAARLGAVTRALHDALASDPADPDFAPEPAGAAHVARWAANTRRAVAEAAESARAAGGAAAALLGARRAAVDALVDAAVAAVGDGAGAAVRHHGDYHLGQVLRGAGGDLFVIDFEGEPAKPLAERRLKHSPLRDVAGMLRSFGYAAGFALRSGAAGGGAAARAAAWEAAARAAFVDAYFAGPRAAYLPPTPGAARALLALFELEKLVYEVRYELLNRPDWADIPLGALRARLTPNPTGA
jgi:maltose alpha-D-glucosyltransferase/alpha-amylase